MRASKCAVCGAPAQTTKHGMHAQSCEGKRRVHCRPRHRRATGSCWAAGRSAAGAGAATHQPAFSRCSTSWACPAGARSLAQSLWAALEEADRELFSGCRTPVGLTSPLPEARACDVLDGPAVLGSRSMLAQATRGIGERGPARAGQETAAALRQLWRTDEWPGCIGWRRPAGTRGAGARGHLQLQARVCSRQPQTAAKTGSERSEQRFGFGLSTDGMQRCPAPEHRHLSQHSMAT